MKFPEIKKTISSFLLSEEGKISKQNILKIGVFLAAASAALSLSSQNLKATDSKHGNVGNCCQCTSHADGYGDHGSCRAYTNIPATHAHRIGIEYQADGSLAYGAHDNYTTAHCNGSNHGSGIEWAI